MKKITSRILLLSLVLGLLSGCQAKPAETAPAKSLQKLSVVLDWYPNALHSFLYTAQEKGYFEEEGLEVELQFPANDNDALTLVAAGKADIGLYYQHDLIQAVANQDIHLKAIGAVVQAPLNAVISLKDKNILSPADLQGKTVGYGGTALSEAIIRSMVQASGGDPDSVSMVNVGFELMSSMTTDNVDATIGGLINHEVPEMEEEGFELNYFTVDAYGVPCYYEALFLVSDDGLKDKSDALAGFLRACRRGFEDFRNDTDGSLKILLDHQSKDNFPLSETVEKKSSEILLPLMESSSQRFLEQSDACWQENIDWMFENGLINRKPGLDELRTVLPE